MSADIINQLIDLIPLFKCACSSIIVFCIIFGFSFVAMILYKLLRDEKKDDIERRRRLIEEIKKEVCDYLQGGNNK